MFQIRGLGRLGLGKIGVVLDVIEVVIEIVLDADPRPCKTFFSMGVESRPAQMGPAEIRLAEIQPAELVTCRNRSLSYYLHPLVRYLSGR